MPYLRLIVKPKTALLQKIESVSDLLADIFIEIVECRFQNAECRIRSLCTACAALVNTDRAGDEGLICGRMSAEF